MRIGRTVVVFVALTLWATAIEGAAADPGVVWHRQPAFSVESAAADGEGHVYVAGFAPRGEPLSFGRPLVMVLAKFDRGGQRLWTRTWRSGIDFYPNAMGFDVSVSPDARDVYVAGAVMNDSGEAGKARVWAYGSTGRLRWVGHTPRVGPWAAVVATPGGPVAGSGQIAAWTRDGAFRWSSSFQDRTGDYCAQIADLGLGPDGEIYAVGMLDVVPTCNDSEGGAFVDADIAIQRRTPTTGALRWSKILRDAGERDNDRAFAVDVAGGRVFVAGTDDARAWLTRMRPSGGIVWTRHWGEDARAASVSVAPWGPVYALADRPAGIVLREYTPANGELRSMWTRPRASAWSAAAVTTGWGGTLYVAAFAWDDTGDLWRLAP